MVRKGCDSKATEFDRSGEVMLIPPILEIFVLWHPDDVDGERIAGEIFGHFHGTAFSGLVGGAIEVYERSVGWSSGGGVPRPLPFVEPVPNLAPAAFTVVVPILGTRLARAVEDDDGWRDYLNTLVTAAATNPTVGVFTVRLDRGVTDPGSVLGMQFPAQGLEDGAARDAQVLCRDLAHSIAGLVGDPMGNRLRVFVSHTKRFSPDEAPDEVLRIVHLVRKAIHSTRLAEFFDEADLQPGADWREELVAAAASSGLLVVRTDLYASRDWCQQEVLVAKRADMPVVVLQALHQGEERGSFLMDHVPSVPLDMRSDAQMLASIERALSQLVDEALKRALWNRQRTRLAALGFDWLPSNAPEPLTLVYWLRHNPVKVTASNRLFVLHPDPPMGNAEAGVIDDLCEVAGIPDLVEILTPRTFASRGGQVAT